MIKINETRFTDNDGGQRYNIIDTLENQVWGIFIAKKELWFLHENCIKYPALSGKQFALYLSTLRTLNHCKYCHMTISREVKEIFNKFKTYACLNAL